MIIFSILLISISLTILINNLLLTYAFEYKKFLLDKASYLGGLGVWASFMIILSVLTFAFNVSFSNEIIGIVLASSLIILFGFIDDVRELSIVAKLIAQLLACFVLIFFGTRTHIMSIGAAFNIAVTVLWVIGITNAFNHLDILDGLCAGVALISSLFLGLFALYTQNYSIALISIIVCGLCLGFLRHNLPQARLYLGNSGSHFLGFLLASLAINISYAPIERPVALISPILILGVAVFDTAFLVVMRIRRKQLIFKKSNDHIALRLLKLECPPKKILILFYSVAFLFGAIGFLIARISNNIGIVLVLLLVFLSLFCAKKLAKIPINA